MSTVDFRLNEIHFNDGGSATGHFKYNLDSKKFSDVEITIKGALFQQEAYTFRDGNDRINGDESYIDICEGSCQGGSKYFRFTFEKPLSSNQNEISIATDNSLHSNHKPRGNSYYGVGDYSTGLKSGSVCILPLEFELLNVHFNDGGSAIGYFNYYPHTKQFSHVAISVSGKSFNGEAYTFRDGIDRIDGDESYIDICEGSCQGGSKYFRLTFEKPLSSNQNEISIATDNSLHSNHKPRGNSYYGVGDYSTGLKSGLVCVLPTNEGIEQSQDYSWWCQPLSLLENNSYSDDPSHRRILAALELQKAWNKKELRYAIKEVTNYSSDEEREKDKEREQIIDRAFKKWNSIGMSLMSFKKISANRWNQADIRIVRDPKRSDYGSLGSTALQKRTDEDTMNLGMRKGLGEAGYVTALHEIGHVLGMIHEHQRSDIAIEWDLSGLVRYFKTRKTFPIKDKPEEKIRRAVMAKITVTNSTIKEPFDPKSVMNYDFPYYCFKKPKKTAEDSIQGSLAKNGIQRSKDLTETDIETALSVYGPTIDL